MRLIDKRLLFLGLLVMGLAGLSPPDVLAQTSSQVTQIESFMRQIIQVIASFAGLIATGFFVLGGISYITSAGDPRAMQRARRTLVFAGLGLIITLGAYALSGIITEIANRAFGA